MNILITSAGQRVSLVRSFQTELKKYFKQGQVFTTDLNPILAPACHVSDQSFAVQRVTSTEYIEQLLQLCLAHNIKLVVPTIDTELLVLSENIETFKKHDIHFFHCSPPLSLLLFHFLLYFHPSYNHIKTQHKYRKVVDFHL